MEESGGDMDYAKFREQHWFDIPDGCHWVGKHLQNALRKIEKTNFEQLHDIFGDAQWTNKKRLSDEKLLDLIEHFSKMDLSVKNVPHDIISRVLHQPHRCKTHDHDYRSATWRKCV